MQTSRVSIKINRKTYHLDSFYADLISFKSFGTPYVESRDKTNALIRTIIGDQPEAKSSQVHQLIVLYCIPKKLQLSFKKQL